MAKRMRKENKRLFEEAKRHLVGGVDSPVRSFSYVGGGPIFIKRAKGSKVYDHDGNEYIDYVLSWGAIVLGHAPGDVSKAVKKAVDSSLAFGTTNEKEIELAAVIKRAIPFIGKIRFVNSGTEAIMGAVRLARGYTGREKIVKFENSYHGHADYLLAKGGSGLATLGIPSSAGVPTNYIKDTIIAPLNDTGAIKKIFKRHGRKLAAVLIEPIGGNFGVIPPDIKFLKIVRKLSARYGVLLIFDEVITGFRFRYGAIAQDLGIIPDIIVLGKIIGGGLPIGAYGGRKDIMDNLAPLGKVYQASTFAGNPIVMRAGLATLNVLNKKKDGYKRIESLTRHLILALENASKALHIDLKASVYKNMFSVKFGDVERFKRFYHLMLEKGVYLAPSEFEANFLSFSHAKKDIEKTIDAAGWALERI